jgi:hypothetical protein
MDQWGRDHFSLLLFVETRVVDYRGRIDWDCVGVSRRNWPMLHSARRRLSNDRTSGDCADLYPLRLRGHTTENSVQHIGHCEADALMDLRDAGVLVITMPKVDPERKVYLKPDGRTPLPVQARPGFTTGLVEWELMPWAKFSLTETGTALAARLREHRGSGLAVAAFVA